MEKRFIFICILGFLISYCTTEEILEISNTDDLVGKWRNLEDVDYLLGGGSQDGDSITIMQITRWVEFYEDLTYGVTADNMPEIAGPYVFNYPAAGGFWEREENSDLIKFYRTTNSIPDLGSVSDPEELEEQTIYWEIISLDEDNQILNVNVYDWEMEFIEEATYQKEQ